MTMPNLRTTEEGMSRAVQLFEATTQEFNGYLLSVNQSWATMQASYGGQSSQAFGQGMDSWEDQFVVVINNLIDMMQKMGVTITSYKSAEEDAAQTANSFTNALPNFQAL
jgi:WXG100 family type VII secretion target